MALAVVNVTKLRSGVSGSVSGAIPDPADDDLMVSFVGTYQGNAANHQASDSENAAYSTVTRAMNSSGSTANCISMHYFQNSVTGAASSGNASGGVGSVAVTAVFYQVSGASTSAAFTAGELAASTGNSSSPNPGAVTNSTAAAIFFAGFVNNDGSAAALMGENAAGTSGTWSTNSSGKETAGNSFQVMGTVYQIVASSAARTHVWQSTNGAAAQWAAINACFNAAVAAGGGVTTVRPIRALLGVGR